MYFDRADVFMIAISSREIIIEINRKGCETLGYPKDEIVGKKWFENFVPKPEQETARRVFHEMLSGSLRHVHNEYSVLSRIGRELVFNWHNVLASDENGNTIGMLSSGVDITERKQAEKTARKIENRLQISIDSMIEGCQIIDYDWRYTYINESAAKQGRKTKQELLGRTMMEAYQGIEKTEMFDHLRNCMTNRVSHKMENLFTFADGSTGWFELRIEPVPEGILVLSLDITKEKEIKIELNKYRNRLEEVVKERTGQLAKLNEKLTMEIHEHRKTEEGLKLRATILEKANEPIFLMNTKGFFAYANEAASKSYGYTLDEFLSLNLSQLLRPEEAPSAESRLKEILEKGQLQLETTHLRKDKTPIHVLMQHSLIKTQHGQFIVSVVRELKIRIKNKRT